MAKFKIGDRVRCVDSIGRPHLVYGKEYEIENLMLGSDGVSELVILKGDHRGYYEHRFELIDPNAAMIERDELVEEDPVEVVEDNEDGEALAGAIGRT